jgi:hypothetical protein
MEIKKCDICGKTFPEEELFTGHGIRHELEDLIRKDHPEWMDSSRICKEDLNSFRIKYITGIIEEEKGSIEALEDAVIKSIKANELITFDTGIRAKPLKTGERIADQVAAFGGSWRFIIIFFLILLAWVLFNSFYLLSRPFDPYPFILLNLILSCLAAIQAPIIMMSQNRQEAKDRVR